MYCWKISHGISTEGKFPGWHFCLVCAFQSIMQFINTVEPSQDSLNLAQVQGFTFVCVRINLCLLWIIASIFMITLRWWAIPKQFTWAQSSQIWRQVTLGDHLVKEEGFNNHFKWWKKSYEVDLFCVEVQSLRPWQPSPQWWKNYMWELSSGWT